MSWRTTIFRVGVVQVSIGVVLAVSLLVLALTLRAAPTAPDVAPVTPATPNAAPVTAAAAHPAPTAATAGTGAPKPAVVTPPSPNVTISISVNPPRMASVFWGKHLLGVIKPRAALVVQRPRDSGPLDLIVRADGCLPVHTRAYTFNDNRLAVRLTTLEQKTTLLGYREELPPPDAGVPLVTDTPLESLP
jgi:hypothetical protein